MSTIYDTEPQPTASVVLHTTGGEIAIEIFAKQTPLTSRNFLQHCLDGYYDNTIFHRLVPGFVLQGGDPTGTGNGGESIYDGGALAGDLDPWPMDERRGLNAGPQGINFKDEFHSRLKFNRRGLLGMANEGKPDTNGSQFFLTLDKTEELNNKNTMFGRVAGSTIYNLMKLGQAEVQEGSERPLYTITLKSVEIVENPFKDMVKHERVAQPQVREPQPAEKSKTKRKKGVNKNLLSFGDDMDEFVEDEVANTRGKSSKKAKIDAGDATRAPAESETRSQHKTELPSRAAPPSVQGTPLAIRQSSSSEPETEAAAPPPKKLSALEKTNAEIAALKASMRRTVPAEPEKNEAKEKKSILESLIPSNTQRGKKLKPRNGLSSHDEKTLKFLGSFASKLGPETLKHGTGAQQQPKLPEEAPEGAAANEEHEEVCDLHFIVNCQSCRPWDKDDKANEDSDDEDWMSHALNCEADRLGKDLSNRRKAEDELIVIDPREKERNIKEEKRAAHDARSDRSRGGRAWDQTRHAKMAQASALSGRGAR